MKAGDDDDADESINDSSGSQDEDNVDRSHHANEQVTSGVVHTPDRCCRDMIWVGDVGFLLLRFIILANYTSRMTMGTAVNLNVGTAQGVIIPQSDIHQADVLAIHDIGIQSMIHREDVPEIHDT